MERAFNLVVVSAPGGVSKGELRFTAGDEGVDPALRSALGPIAQTMQRPQGGPLRICKREIYDPDVGSYVTSTILISEKE